MSLPSLETLDMLTLPTAPFASSQLVPNVRALYFITAASDQKLLYIGASRSLQRRVVTHHMRRLFAPFTPVNISWLEVADDVRLDDYERAAITYFKPLLNDGGPNPLKPGPTPKGFVRVNAFLPPEMIEWSKNHPEGLSGLIRRLLTQERKRIESEQTSS